MTYRARYMGVFETAPVIDRLVLDESNPRSIAHQIATLKARAAALPRATPSQSRGRDKEIVEAIHARLRGIDARALTDIDAKGGRSALRTLVDLIQTRLAELSNEYSESYFRLVGRQRAGAAPRHRPAGAGSAE